MKGYDSLVTLYIVEHVKSKMWLRYDECGEQVLVNQFLDNLSVHPPWCATPQVNVDYNFLVRGSCSTNAGLG